MFFQTNNKLIIYDIFFITTVLIGNVSKTTKKTHKVCSNKFTKGITQKGVYDDHKVAKRTTRCLNDQATLLEYDTLKASFSDDEGSYVFKTS